MGGGRPFAQRAQLHFDEHPEYAVEGFSEWVAPKLATDLEES